MKRNFLLIVALILASFVVSCTKDSSFLGGIEEEYIPKGDGNTTVIISEDGYKADFRTKTAELYTKEQVLTLSLDEVNDENEVVKATTLKHDLNLNALFTLPDTVYVDSEEALTKVELQKNGEISSNVERSTEDGIAKMSISRGFSFTFNEGEVVEANTLYQKENTDSTEFAFTAVRSVEYESFDVKKVSADADSIVYDVTLHFIVSLNRNGEEENIDEYSVDVPYQRIYRVEKSVEPENPGDDGDDNGDDDGDDEKVNPTPDPDPDPTPDPDDKGGDDGKDDGDEKGDPTPDPTPNPNPDPDPDPDKGGNEPEPEQPKPSIEKNIPSDWGTIIGMGVSAAPADDVQGHYAVWTWCLRTTEGAVVAKTAENQMPTVEDFKNGYFVKGNFDESYNGGYFTTSRNAHGLRVGAWAPAHAYTNNTGVHYSYQGSIVANVYNTDLKFWNWRGGNFTTDVNGYTFTVDQFGVLFINGQAFAR